MAHKNVLSLLTENNTPETYNFEFESDYDDYMSLSPLERFLVYKSTGEGQKISDNYIHKHKDVKYYYRSALFSLDNYWRYPNLVDCDGWDGECSLAVDLYKTLWNWKPYGAKHWKSQFGEIEGLGPFGGDTLNSVQTTLNRYLEFMLDDNEEYRQHMEGETPSAAFYLQLYCLYAQNFTAQFDEKKELMEFVELCHTLGNLMPVPAEYNGYRGKRKYLRDYFDLSLDNLKNSRDGNHFLGENNEMREQNFRKCVNIFFLWDCVDANYEVIPLCESHKKKLEVLEREITMPDAEFVLPNKEEIDDLCRNINGRINRRSLFMIAMLRIALGINTDGREEALEYIYNGKYGKWADWNASGIYKKLMEDVFMTDTIYSGGYEEVIKVIKDKIAGNPDEKFVNAILDELKRQLKYHSKVWADIVEEAVEGEKRFEEFNQTLENDPIARAQWEEQKNSFLHIDI